MHLQAWYATHPPARGEWWMGTRPFVHQGFLKSWVANGLNARIVERCVAAVKMMQAQAHCTPVKLYITGAHLPHHTRGSRPAVAMTLHSALKLHMHVDPRAASTGTLPTDTPLQKGVCSVLPLSQRCHLPA